MKLSPLDIRHMEFERTAVGYRTRQVREFLERVASESEAVLHEVQSLRSQVADKDATIEALRATEAELKRTVVAAERIANEVKEHGTREADLVVRQAKQERLEMLREAAAQLDAARTELARLDHAQALVREQLRGQLTAFLAALDAKPSSRRHVAGDDVANDVIEALKATVAEARHDATRPRAVAARQPRPSSVDDAPPERTPPASSASSSDVGTPAPEDADADGDDAPAAPGTTVSTSGS